MRGRGLQGEEGTVGGGGVQGGGREGESNRDRNRERERERDMASNGIKVLSGFTQLQP